MLTRSPRSLRTRWTAFTGSFVALALGVALLTVMGLALAAAADAPDRAPQRFAAAPVVVRGVQTLRVPTPHGVRTAELAHPRPVPPGTVAALRALGEVTEDRSFPVRAEGGPSGLVGHPWPTAVFAPYELSAGRAPRAADEVVITGGWAAVGDRLRTGHGTVRVVGTVTGPAGVEDAVFCTAARAARLAPVSEQLVVDADPAAVRRAVGDRAQVLTGDARRLADADPGRDAAAVTALNSLFGTAGGVAAFVSVSVVASTFAFTVAQRRREFGLLRLAGATPGQVRRTVYTEALLVGAAASAAGCALGGHAAPYLAARVVAGGLAPGWFVVGDHTWPYHAAFWTGLTVALCGVVAASWRAGRTGPAEALREASVDHGTLTRGRLLAGTALLAAAAAAAGWALLTDPADLLHRKTYISRPMLLITAVALLSPPLVRPLVRLVAWPATRLPGAGGILVRENAAAGVRRAAAVAAPVLTTVALTGSLLGATATLDAAGSAEARVRTTADYVVTAAGLDAATVRRLAAVPGTAAVSASATSAVYVVEEGVALVRSAARAADPAALAATTRLPVTAGRLTDLDDDSIVVNEEWERHTVGQRVPVRLGDGTRRTLRIAAVLAVGTGDNGAYVTPANAPGAPVDRVEVTVAAGADRDAVAAGLRKAAGSSGAEVRTAAAWLRATAPRSDGTTRLGFLLVLGIALVYAAIALAGTQVMATAGRRRELTALRMAGATTPQVLGLVAAEALTVAVVGALLGVLVAALNLGAMTGALALLSAPAAPVLPWSALGATAGACAVVAVVAAVLTAGRSTPRRP